jgi:hypothetical protein
VNNHSKRSGSIAVHAALLGTALGVFVWLLIDYPENPRWYDPLGVVVWAVLVGWSASMLFSVLQRRWAPPMDVTVECVTCDGTGASGDPETNGQCWDCLGSGVVTYVS